MRDRENRRFSVARPADVNDALVEPPNIKRDDSFVSARRKPRWEFRDGIPHAGWFREGGWVHDNEAPPA